MKGMIKETDEHPGEEMHTTRCGRVPKHRSSVPLELWRAALSRPGGVSTAPEALQTSYLRDVYGGFILEA